MDYRKWFCFVKKGIISNGNWDEIKVFYESRFGILSTYPTLNIDVHSTYNTLIFKGHIADI